MRQRDVLGNRKRWENVPLLKMCRPKYGVDEGRERYMNDMASKRKRAPRLGGVVELGLEGSTWG